MAESGSSGDDAEVRERTYYPILMDCGDGTGALQTAHLMYTEWHWCSARQGDFRWKLLDTTMKTIAVDCLHRDQLEMVATAQP